MAWPTREDSQAGSIRVWPTEDEFAHHVAEQLPRSAQAARSWPARWWDTPITLPMSRIDRPASASTLAALRECFAASDRARRLVRARH